MTDYRSLLPAASEAIDLAADLIRTLQPGVLTVKGDRDMASEVDYAIEQQVREFLHERTPGIGFLGEEQGASGASAYLTWALDPIDGTVNFIHGHPLYAVSLGLVEGNRTVLGVIDVPFFDARYAAVDGHGAHVNGRPIKASQTAELEEAVVAIGDYAVGEEAEKRNHLRLAVTQRFAARAQRLRMHGSAAIDLVWLAEGKIDAVVICSNRPWDTSAGVIIAREAGAHVLDMDGSVHTTESKATIAAPYPLIQQTLSVVQSAHKNFTNPAVHDA